MGHKLSEKEESFTRRKLNLRKRKCYVPRILTSSYQDLKVFERKASDVNGVLIDCGNYQYWTNSWCANLIIKSPKRMLHNE